ncbi:FAD-dependent oxidoreductase [Mycobacterium sp. E3247]|uniref:FAD-dependent oxidoreductase n=1 Tax=Mycobacterium sp. E3247 TaxID=1856864 RepID=UPI0007FBFE9A|nr:FAD-dependent oxidoreductase [Mycobacterium sp. E3247]OBH22005.1 amino acid oxidase [Mycobacterium sp. E3247]
MTARPDRPGALVIGAGVSGWTTALVLARRGWRVVVAADRFGVDTVSTVAGALWEWPPSVCGRHHDQSVLGRSAEWARYSYIRFARLAADPRTGVSLRPAVFYFSRPVDEDPAELTKMIEVERFVPGFMRDPDLIAAHGVSPDAGVVDAYSYLAPTIDTDWYLAWLGRQSEAAGVTVSRRSVRGPLADQEDELLAEYGVELIINCSGLGARELAGDPTVVPHRGALLRVVNDGNYMPRVTAAHAVANDTSTDNQDMVFIVPRGANRLLLGGLVETGEYSTDLALDSYAPLREMLDRCTRFLPILRDARLDPVDPVRVGLRPFREGGVRLQHEPGTRVVHNYGHGGAGVTLSWGCADEAAQLADAVLAQQGVA